jgi:hypothetical protein
MPASKVARHRQRRDHAPDADRLPHDASLARPAAAIRRLTSYIVAGTVALSRFVIMTPYILLLGTVFMAIRPGESAARQASSTG